MIRKHRSATPRLARRSKGWAGPMAARSASTIAGASAGAPAGCGRGIGQPGAKTILSEGTPVTQALLRETRSIPIVFVASSDPLSSGWSRAWRVPAEM